MAFAYEIMRGRQGAAGHCQETAGKTTIHARGFRPGETCALYALTRDGAEKRDETQADSNGQAVLTGKSGNTFFIVSEGSVRLWQGGEDNYLRATEWLQRQKRIQKQQQSASSLIQPEEAQKMLAKDLEEIQTAPVQETGKKEEDEKKEEKEQTKEEEKSVPLGYAQRYTLRPAGSGEPVDTLPE